MDAITAPPAAPPVIRREDYQPPAWLVPQIRLKFALGLEQTRVQASLNVERNPAAAAQDVLRLNGDGLAAVGVWVDGAAISDWQMDGSDLLVPLTGDRHEIGIETVINPAANTQLMGLYASGGMLCTQCEAEGFRRITFFPDRPDVLSVYTVQMTGPKDQFPVLLSNGNCTASGAAADGTHWAEWHDPWPKPSYLFALVAGDLVANHDTFTTMSGRKVDLNIWVREGDQDRTHHAMQALKDSMKWDEEVFGREYDLDLFNIVAVFETQTFAEKMETEAYRAELERTYMHSHPAMREMVKLLDLERRWPIGDPGSADFFFCGGQTVSGLPYCAYHSRVAYQPANQRRDRRPFRG